MSDRGVSDGELSSFAFNNSIGPLSQNCSQTNNCNRVV